MMRKHLLIVALVLVTLLGGVGAVNSRSKPLEPQDMIEQHMDSVCHIQVETEWESWQGSGSYIGDGLVLTAGHVVEGAVKFTMTFEDGTVVEADRFYKEPTMDVGFIYVGELDIDVLEFDMRKLRRGDVTYIFGNPLGWDNRFSVSRGIVSSLDKEHGGYFGEKLMFNSDAASYPGNSGGPVLDEDGEIIGILVGGYVGTDNLSLCVPTDVVVAARGIYLAQLELERIE
jgi:S1-C subfamily serine protease